jgi:hypothetical protein
MAQQHLGNSPCRRVRPILQKLAPAFLFNRRFAGTPYRPGTAVKPAPMLQSNENEQFNL